jgi:hypothetical protein
MKLRRILSIFLIFAFLVGCSNTPLVSTSEEVSSSVSPPISGPPSSSQEPVTPPSPSPEPTPAGPVLTEINHYFVPPDENAHMDDAAKENYRRLVDAVFRRDPEIRLSDSYDENLFSAYMLKECPYYFLVESLKFSGDHKTILLTYAYSERVQTEMVRFLDDEFLSILNGMIRTEDNELERVLKVYRYFSHRIEYNYDWYYALHETEDPYLFPNIEVYEALKTNRGVCHSYSFLCNFALAQLNIDSFGVTGSLIADENEYHMWLLVKINGKFYYCDPTWDRTDDTRVGLNYFGMTQERRIASGVLPDGNFLQWHEEEYGDAVCDDLTFSIFEDVVDFSFTDNHMIELVYANGEIQTYNTQTLSFV